MEIFRTGSELHVKMKLGLTSADTISISKECNSAIYADLLADKLRLERDNIVRQIRQEEYNRGWKDAKAKRRKENWFSGTFKRIYG